MISGYIHINSYKDICFCLALKTKVRLLKFSILKSSLLIEMSLIAFILVKLV